jgi:hypothetical protein
LRAQGFKFDVWLKSTFQFVLVAEGRTPITDMERARAWLGQQMEVERTKFNDVQLAQAREGADEFAEWMREQEDYARHEQDQKQRQQHQHHDDL